MGPPVSQGSTGLLRRLREIDESIASAADCRYGRRVRRGAALLVIGVSGLLSTGCIFSRMFWYNTPSLAAPEYFESRVVHASTSPAPLQAGKELALALTPGEQKTWGSFDAMLEQNQTAAFLVLRDDRVVYERYFGKVDARTLLPSFSISKTYAALLAGCAIDDGLIESPRSKLVQLVPELSGKKHYESITIEHLLRMTSGIDFEEESVAGAMFYYSKDLRGRLYDYDVKWTPGTHYLYGSVNIQLLWDALHRRLGDKTVSQYFEERLWGPLGAESSATWSLDSGDGGVEKLFGGFNATARDHARIGLLFLHAGTFANHQVVRSSWVDASLDPDPVAGILETSDGWVRRGKYQWFLTLDKRAYFAKGYHGQYVFLVPEKNLLFVRFAEGYGKVDWPALFLRLSEQMP